ncbi:DUF6116 family protein [Solilutibacter silvestris]|uniref:Uncharacterized protein n=1 Tax=Solilutibacter silvestris TaxID=1645665 RepID=A0A2K1PYC2_9GAMM|nr:DUF6116 family protein [Lysobacter silvestris]PNS07783.1 hypothetical protein Lysil_1959 [Lysobacter silvestris]
MRHFLFAPFLKWLGRLSHPKLFIVAGLLAVLHIAMPDPIWPIDEAFLGVVALILAKWKKKDPGGKSSGDAQPPIEGSATRR